MTTVRLTRILAAGGAGLLAVSALAACGGASEQAAQTMAEEAVEGAIGGDVDISDDSMTVTDAEGNEMAVGSDITIPDTWPAEVPLFDGTLSVASVQADGTAYAMWTTDLDASSAADTYGESLATAGYSLTQDATVGTMVMREYSSPTRTVSVVSGEVDGATSLTVTSVAL